MGIDNELLGQRRPFIVLVSELERLALFFLRPVGDFELLHWHLGVAPFLVRLRRRIRGTRPAWL
jgi:hypothetical protein